MKSMFSLKHAQARCIAAALLSLPSPAYAASLRTMYSFSGGTDGAYPGGYFYGLGEGGAPSGLVNVGGLLYGITSGGGAYGVGTVFKVTKSGVETVLYSFTGGRDGYHPDVLINVGGTLYGSTHGLGEHDGNQGVHATVFSLTTNNVESALTSFGSPINGGADPYILTNAGGTLYGMLYIDTSFFFKLTKVGVEKTYPDSNFESIFFVDNLINVGGKFYGTGGGDENPYGAIFSLTAANVESVVYSFKGGSDGANPTGLINFSGTFYGVTSQGGNYGYGTVFSLTTGGVKSILYNFKGGTDGAYPSSVIDVGGTFYGTTHSGGANGSGTVFKLTADGSETTLSSFGGKNGDDPSNLIDVDGVLYGITYKGGAYGYGTVFKVVP
jgi:uncharacterized repeat protein (TIGR03803 family)